MVDITSILVNSFAILFASTGFLTSFTILSLFFYHRQRHPIQSSTVLICNTYLTTLFLSALLIDLHAHLLYADFYTHVSFDETWCYVRGYLLHVILCLLYHSYLLQSIFRFFRIMLYSYKQLQRRKLMIIVILIDWFLIFTLESLMLIFQRFHYIDQCHFCDILIDDNLSMLTTGAAAYTFPMVAISLIYFTIIRYMKNTRIRLIQDNRQLSAQRDLVVLRRIFILVSLLTSLCIPVTGFWLMYFFTGNVMSIAYRIGWLSVTLPSSMLPIITVYLTPELRELIIRTFRKNHCVHPALIPLNRMT